MTANEIRKQFLDFFASKGHTVVPSAPMVIKNDPTLMFTNAGMNQFKDIFLGNKTRFTARAADAQKCLRVSGKHNDLEVVGHDGYHHTMFEMLGNWSFGDYFKTEAIAWAWELLTEVYKIDKEKLYVTVFEGSAEDGTSLDEEARQAWLKFVPENHIVPGNKHDNFWEMGDTGPCGPCSEIHIDLRPDAERAKLPGEKLVNMDNPLVIEIWNLVFMQYVRMADGHLEPLPNKNIDTGMGFERLCMVLQGKTSNYDTDVFSPCIHRIEELSGHKYGADAQADVAFRVIADHLRAIAFAIADGQLPGNVKAGYVIRRILRRAVRYGYTFLGFTEPFLCRLVPGLVEDMGGAYPELGAQQKLVENVIREEELAFLRTLDRGIRLLDDYMARNAASKVLPGVDAFVLYDTFGFPIDLTQLIAGEKGFTVDMDGFQAELEKQKARARNATANTFGDWTVWHEGENVRFTGWDETEHAGALLLKSRTVVEKKKEMLQLVFDVTPFYGEMGGEVGDTGTIVSASGEEIRILDTVKENELTIHIAEKLPQDCEGAFTLKVDAARRARIAANHSCTHLLDTALREVLGTHVEQKGSYVCDGYLRFDFSHFEKLSQEQIIAVERRVNALIREDLPLVEKRDATMEEARSMGAIALFGEKYGDRVRVVNFGPSTELCGGCHASSTGKIGFFKITSEAAIAAGVRRIEAVTGENAENLVLGLQQTMRDMRDMLKGAPDVNSAIKKMIEENDDYKKQLAAAFKEKTLQYKEKVLSLATEIGGHRVIKIDWVPDFGMLREAATMLQKEADNLVVAAALDVAGKPQLLLMYSHDLVAQGWNAGADLRAAAQFIQGGGGGQPGLAMAGGRNVAGLPEALEAMLSKLQ